MWIDIGPAKETLLRGHHFDIVGMGFVRRGKSKPWMLSFAHVRDTSLAALRAELSGMEKR